MLGTLAFQDADNIKVGSVTATALSTATLATTGNATLGDAEASDTHAIKGATTLLANSASAALTVTQTGAGNAFVVEDSASTDSTPFVINGGGSVTVGHTSNPSLVGVGINFAVVGTDNTTSAAALARYSADTDKARLVFIKSRGAIGAAGVVSSGDSIGDIIFSASDGTNNIETARIRAEVDGTPGTNDMPGRLVFSTTADGASSPTERMRIDSAGTTSLYGATMVSSNQSVASANLTVSGSPSMSTSAIIGIANNVTLVGGAATVQYRAFSNETTCAPTVIGGTGFGILNTTTLNNDKPVASHYQNYTRTDLGASQLGGTISTLAQNNAISPTINAAATTNITTYFSYRASSVAQGASQTITNIFGFYSDQVAGTNRYSFYAAGTADNYFAGSVGIGGTAPATTKIYVAGTLPTVSTNSNAFRVQATIPSGATGTSIFYDSIVTTQAAAFTLTTAMHFRAYQDVLGASSAITSQYGFIADATLTSATNNYGFYSNIASAANRYNFYAAGTAQNYFAGVTGIGVAPVSTSQLTVAASTTGVSSLNIPHGAAPSSPVNGDVWSTTAGLFIRINGVTKTVTLT